MRRSKILFGAFLDGFTLAGFFTKLRPPGAATYLCAPEGVDFECLALLEPTSSVGCEPFSADRKDEFIHETGVGASIIEYDPLLRIARMLASKYEADSPALRNSLGVVRSATSRNMQDLRTDVVISDGVECGSTR